MAERTKVKIFLVENSFIEVVKVIEGGNLYVCRDHFGVCVFVNRNFDGGYKLLMYNPRELDVLRIILDFNQFKDIFGQILAKDCMEHYMFEDNEEINLIEQYAMVSDALTALEEGSYGDYKVKYCPGEIQVNSGYTNPDLVN